MLKFRSHPYFFRRGHHGGGNVEKLFEIDYSLYLNQVKYKKHNLAHLLLSTKD